MWKNINFCVDFEGKKKKSISRSLTDWRELKGPLSQRRNTPSNENIIIIVYHFISMKKGFIDERNEVNIKTYLDYYIPICEHKSQYENNT